MGLTAKRTILIVLAAILILVVLGVLIVFAINQTYNSNNGKKTTTTVTTTQTGTFQVSSIDMAVNPTSIDGLACGTNTTITYTATFHVTSHTQNQTVAFTYTTNNGRSSQPATLTFTPSETTKTYSFTWAGSLSSDNVNPGNGGVQVSSPNNLTSSMVKPTGTCTQEAFKVTSIDLTVAPQSIATLSCNTSQTFTYTATFHIAPNTQGGTINFSWTVNNGRSSTAASVIVNPGEISKTYTFSTTGSLTPDHTFPGMAQIMTTSPNTIASDQVQPTGICK